MTLANLIAPDGPFMLALAFWMVYRRGKLDMFSKIVDGPKFKSLAFNIAIGITLIYSTLSHLGAGMTCWKFM